ncbi:hypothetical protein LZ480_12225 [Solibacillus sp. MA9]|uniref:DUF308 domain-containing protein n=1 Tax=Solibacillus palustris TaxID=2908203 RepID=A0ABS9UEZ3_9BACL|nr:hypothetical protein [Solibacillus sp. MA9]MCH7322659.1 hypothetical protein [Solibacillus sp. MA9]
MKNRSEEYIPLVVTVGQVAISPYYIVWLKEVSLTFTLFAWLFAAFSFAAAWGYRVFQSKKNKNNSYMPFIYVGMGIVYILVGCIKNSFEILLYAVLLLQVILGFLQGFFRAWHIEQKAYHLQTVHHYLIVGVTMIGLSFVKIISPVVFVTFFGILLCACGFWTLIRKKEAELI